METLNSIKANLYYRITDFASGENEKIVRRLCDLGLVPGEIVRVTNRSLLKKATLVEVKGYVLTLKSSIANSILVERK